LSSHCALDALRAALPERRVTSMRVPYDWNWPGRAAILRGDGSEESGPFE
jgi:hypothetical protein